MIVYLSAMEKNEIRSELRDATVAMDTLLDAMKSGPVPIARIMDVNRDVLSMQTKINTIMTEYLINIIGDVKTK